VLSIQGDRAVGSVRSIPGVHAVRALESASDLLEKFGGHPAAAGFTVPTEAIDSLRTRLCTWVTEQIGAEALVPESIYDAELGVDELHEQLLNQILRLGPFGMGNPAPRLKVRQTHVRGVRVMGKDRRHIKWSLRSHGVDAVWWGGAEHLDTLQDGAVDLLGSLTVNVWRGRRSLQFVVRDARRCASA
jgi:single-stranded-DNA-specific exonuclease